jgi:Holliday junction DNA helicase RuvA
MIDSVTGKIVTVTETSVVLMVGGVGLRVRVPTTVRDLVDGPGQTLTLYTRLVVREEDLTLYGFADQEERGLFETLIGIAGIGPRIALSILSTLTADHLKNAVAHEDPDVLTRVPGIGKKLAQKLVFELKDRLVVDHVTGLAAISDVDTDVLAALTALGYSVVEAQAAIQSIPRDAPQEVEERVRLALQYFA